MSRTARSTMPTRGRATAFLAGHGGVWGGVAWIYLGVSPSLPGGCSGASSSGARGANTVRPSIITERGSNATYTHTNVVLQQCCFPGS